MLTGFTTATVHKLPARLSADLLTEQTGTNVTYYLYDENGSVIGFEYNGPPYYYLKNIQGDVVSIVDNSGVVVVNYTYNAWGEIVSISGTMADTIGQVNKLRYRSYYYDSETGFYYLQSRYYDPVVKRFISPDSTDYLTENGSFDGHNLYAYCMNNPIIYFDSSGEFAIALFSIAQVVLCAIAAISVVALLANPSVQSAMNKAIALVGKSVITLCESLAEAVTKALKKAKLKSKNSKTEVHHIVAQKDRRAKNSRLLLDHKNVKIGINDPINKVSIKYNLHKHIHTNAYHAAVYSFLKKGKGSYSRTVAILNCIKALLLTMSSQTP